jgi:hypothetical protein
MKVKVGIVGLPNVGKSTLFNALLQRQVAQIGNYPFTTIDPNTGVVEVPDDTLFRLAKVLGISRVVPAMIEFVDIAGLVKNAHQGEGLGNQFLSHIREVDAILHIVRDFENPQALHIHKKINPFYDIKVINLELILADFEVVTRVLSKIRTDSSRRKVLEKIKKVLEKERFAKEADLKPEEKELIRDLNLLTLKPVIYVINTSESKIKQIKQESFQSTIGTNEMLALSAKLELEISQLTPKEQKEYFQELGINQSLLGKLIQKTFSVLRLIRFYTIKGAREAHAWPLKKGSTALQAAEQVHTDFAQGFIKAEVISAEELIQLGSWQKAKERGKIKTEGKTYLVQDKDVLEFKFHSIEK